MAESRAGQIPLAPESTRIRRIERASRFDQAFMKSRGLAKLTLRLRRLFLPYYFLRPPALRVRLRAHSRRERMAPDFFCIGAVRSGTTSLADHVLQHPCVVLPLSKEIGGPDRLTQRLFAANFPTLQEKRRVEAEHGMAITGYCTPALPALHFPSFAAAVAPDARVILLLRNPVDRTFAHWRHEQGLVGQLAGDPLRRLYPDFHESMRLEIEAARLGAGSGFVARSGVRVGGYLQHGIYFPFVAAILRSFERDRVLVLDSGDFFADSAGVTRRVHAFLGLPDYEPVVMPVQNAGPRGRMDAATRELLAGFFETPNRMLFELIDEELDWR